MMKKNTKTLCVRTNIQAGSKEPHGPLIGYSQADCMERCKETASEDACKRYCGKKA